MQPGSKLCVEMTVVCTQTPDAICFAYKCISKVQSGEVICIFGLNW